MNLDNVDPKEFLLCGIQICEHLDFWKGHLKLQKTWPKLLFEWSVVSQSFTVADLLDRIWLMFLHKFELHINKHYVISFDTILPFKVVKMVKDVQQTIQRVHQSFAFCFRLMPVKAEFRIGWFMISTNLDIFVSLVRFETRFSAPDLMSRNISAVGRKKLVFGFGFGASVDFSETNSILRFYWFDFTCPCILD